MRRSRILPTLGVVYVGILVVLTLVAPKLDVAQAEEKISPERQAVYKEIEAAFGFVPGFIKTIPDVSLRADWDALRTAQMTPGAIPNKYRELIGLAVAASRGCEYCAYFHTEFAKLNGATDAEIEDAVHFAKSNAGWSTYLHGMQYDYGQFKKDVDQICANARAKSAKK
jgi:AhpD family alkylhydroperoxidase